MWGSLPEFHCLVSPQDIFVWNSAEPQCGGTGWCVSVCRGFSTFTCSHTLSSAPWRLGGAQWFTCDLLQQFSTGRAHGHQRLSNSPRVPWQVPSTHSSQEASPHSSLQQWPGKCMIPFLYSAFTSLWWIWARLSAKNTTCSGTGFMNGSLAWVCSSVIEEQQVWSHHL